MTKSLTKKDLRKDPNLMVPICYDEIFKEVFGNEDYPDITAYLVSKLLDMPYSNVKGKIKFVGLRHKEARVKDKKAEKDVVFMLDVEEPYKINFEMNYNPKKIKVTMERNLYYLANLHGNGLKEKEEYTEIIKSIQYNFNTCFIDDTHREIIDEYSYLNKHGWLLSEKSKIVQLNIAEMKNIWYSGNYKNYGERMQTIICFGALIMCKVKKDFYRCLEDLNAPTEIKEDIKRIVEKMNDNEEIFVRYYNREEEEDRINRSWIAQSKKDAKKENSIEIAKSLANQGVDLSIISTCTKLSIKELEEILKKDTK